MERKRLVKWGAMSDAIANGALTVTFLDTNVVKTFAFDAIPDETKHQLFVNGLKQKLADCAADPEVNNETAYDEMYTRLVAGEYSAKREGTGSGPRMGVFPQAYMRYLAEQGTELTIEAVRERIETKTAEWKAANKKGTFRAAAVAHPRIAALMAEIEAERAKPVAPASDTDL